jgi:hypothetical protein
VGWWGGEVVRWCGGAVVRWCGGAVVRWCGGAVVRASLCVVRCALVRTLVLIAVRGVLRGCVMF